MPPAQRRADRSRMYNLAGHAHSSGSLLPRSTDVHAASASAGPSSTQPARGVDAADAPYLTNLESHFGRVTLTAPDNLLRKQAKEKKQKVRQRKAQNAHAAAAALAAPSHAALSPNTPRNAGVSTGLLDPGRRYQAALDDAAAGSGLLLSAPGQQGVMRRAHSGNQTPTLASTSYLQTPPAPSAQTTATRVRRRRQSIARDDASRPASRASATSRPDSALSFNDDENPQPDPGSAQTRDAPRRSRTESAPAAQRRSQNAFASPVDTAPSGASRPHPQPALQQSLHRQNVWNDITEDDPDDLPPPFPEGAPRPPTPPQPPSHSEAAADAQLIAPQPHTRIPDSPPPPFVSDDEDEPSVGGAATTQEHTGERPRSRASTTSSASASGDESVELTEERRAWESDLRNGLSFDVRLLREQQRRVARERAAVFQAREQQQSARIEEDAATSEATADGAGSEVEAQPEAPAQSAQQEPVSAVKPASPQVPSDAAAEAEASPNRLHDAFQDDPSVQAEEAPAVESPVSPDRQLTSASVAAEARPAVQAATANDIADISGRLSLSNEPRLGLPQMPQIPQIPQPPASQISNGQDAIRSPRSSHILGHRKTNSDTPNAGSSRADNARPNVGVRASVGGAPGHRIELAHAARTHGSDSHLPLSRRPEDTLFVISAPPPAVHARAASGDEANTSCVAQVDDTAVPVRDVEEVSSHDEDDGAESDSSIEQWLAEAAAFDALRKREDEAAARVQQLREHVSESSESEQDMPGAFNVRPSRRTGSKVPDPERLKLMDEVLPKAPPPLVLGRSRGGAAFSDSDSTDTDDALDQYSSSDEDDDQHRAFRDAAAGGEADAFADAHSSVHARNSSSAPNLSILDEAAGRNLLPGAKVVDGPERKLSVKARGKLPERPEPPSPANSAAGPPHKHDVPETRAGEFQEDSSSSRDVSDADEMAPVPRADFNAARGRIEAAPLASRSGMEPLLQPLGYGRSRPDVGGRLKGLFGQPLVASADAAVMTAVEGPHPMNGSRRASNRSVKEQDAVAGESESAPAMAPSMRRQSSGGTRKVSSTQTPEQKARDEALAQIAQISGAQAKHDSLAALERLLAKTGRPTSMLPPSAMSRAELGGRLQPPSGSGESDAPPAGEKSEAPPAPPARSRLSRQGAVRGRVESVVPSQGLSRAPSTARPVSFVNPRSSAAPLPRGRLPAITDATRHFPPSASTGPGVTPSWLAYIPSEEQERLPAPLEPLRIGRVSEMVSRFEAAPSTDQDKPTSPTKRAAASFGSPQVSRDADAAVFRRFNPDAGEGGVQRRPPPPPPTHPRQSGDMDALARQIDEAASAWTQSHLAVPESSGLIRSPRTVAMDTLTGRDAPSLPPKSPLMTQEHIMAAASRNGLSASIAAAQAASWARRERNSEAGRPLPMLPPSVRGQGLGIESVHRGLPMPPPLPTRPPRERWMEETDAKLLTGGTTASSDSSTEPARLTARASASQQQGNSGGTVTRRSQNRDGGSSEVEERASMQSRGSTPAYGGERTSSTASTATYAQGNSSNSQRRPDSSGSAQQWANGSSSGGQRRRDSPGDAQWAKASSAAGHASVYLGAHRGDSDAKQGSASTTPRTWADSSGPAAPWGDASTRAPLWTNSAGSAGQGANILDVHQAANSPAAQMHPSSSAALARSRAIGSSATAQARTNSSTSANQSQTFGATTAAQERANASSSSRPWANSLSSADQGAPDSSMPASQAQAVGSIPAAQRGDSSGRDSWTQSSSPGPLVQGNSSDSTCPSQVASASTPPSDSTLSRRLPTREGSLGLTDFDLLVAQLEREGAHYEQLSAIGEFLGPAKPTGATAAELGSLSVGRIECDARRVTREGKVKQKLSCVGVRVDKCTICMAQFREDQKAVILPCVHVFHQECAVALLKTANTCPTCRQPAF
ncbi:FOG: Predicted E3 ubiquitin ligase [Moesziomyces antarcticus T-34]|uniref:FOG: Predicted E3 ubiquitin ligase n=1 Tax=Pseudozyma antarctica (strain T-34) TaxID=1151754 RepID=M9M4D3_PSEA3|nr:FOG: Predicted E3 ubiquitin ligase [Moesziomyces antarcticus T-34]